jgi:hypothetical protein
LKVLNEIAGCLFLLLCISVIPALTYLFIIQPSTFFVVVFALIVFGVIFKQYRKNLKKKREVHIRLFTLPAGLLLKLIKKHPNLALADAQLVDKAMRQFFLAYHFSNYRFVAMPSEVVDDLWHEFILYTRTYELFCKQAFGRFFHHSPAVMLNQTMQSDESLRRTWWFACQDEVIDPKKPYKLPLLFAIDATLNINNGRVYSLDCHQDGQVAGTHTYCVGDFSNSGNGCGGGSCSGGFSDSTADGGGDSGGGDSGCGGGCGGGGGD